MKALLDERGFLKIARNNGEYADQFCPTREIVFCGTWCPLFGEIEEMSGSQVRIPICQGRLLTFSEVKQEETDT